MIFDSKIQLDRKRAEERLNFFLSKGKVFELTEKKERRSIQQNKYLHLILSWYALEYGETLEYVKREIFKKQLSRDIFLTEYINRKTGEIREDWRSSKDLDTGEMTTAIDRFRNYATKEAGIYLPEPKDLALLQHIENEIENHKQYL